VVGEVEGVAMGEITGEGDGVAELVGEALLVEEAVGAGVVSACESEVVEAMTSAKSAIPTLGIMADPLGLTLSSIRRKSLYK